MTAIDAAPEAVEIARARVRSANVSFEVADVDPGRLERRLRRLGWDCVIRRGGGDWVCGEARVR